MLFGGGEELTWHEKGEPGTVSSLNVTTMEWLPGTRGTKLTLNLAWPGSWALLGGMGSTLVGTFCWLRLDTTRISRLPSPASLASTNGH